MFIATDPIAGPHPLAYLDPDLSEYVAPLITLFRDDPDAAWRFVLVASPQAVEGEGGEMPGPIAAYPVGSDPESESAPIDPTLYLADCAFHTSATDTPANQTMRPHLLEPLTFTARIPAAATESGGGSAQFGTVEITNADTQQTDYARYRWVGRVAEIYAGGTMYVGTAREVSLAFADYELLYKGVVTSAAWSRSVLSLGLQPATARLARAITFSYYDGSGGLNGGADVSGKPRPLAFGVCRNVQPVTVDATNRIYQVHDGSINAVSAVRDNGVALAFDANVADITTATPGAGEYATSTSAGYIKLGSAASGAITVDLEGDDTPSYINDVPNIVRRIATSYGPLVDPDDIDAVSFSNAASSLVAGIFISSPATHGDIYDRLMPSINGWWSFNRAGQLRIGVYAQPDATTSPDETIDESLVVGDSVAREVTAEPIHRLNVGYKPMYHVQDADGLDSTVTDADRLLYSTPMRYVQVIDANTLSNHPAAREVSIETVLDTLADATTLANTILARDRTEMHRYSVRKKRDLFSNAVGDVVLLDLPRWGLSGGKRAQIVGITESASERAVDLELVVQE